MSGGWQSPRAPAPRGEAGFTLLEMTIVLGLLAVFLVALTQLLSSGVDLLEEGEVGQELADVSDAAATATADALGDIVGPASIRVEPGMPSARLRVDWVPLGLATEPSAEVQAIRGTVRLAESTEVELLRSKLEPVAREQGSQSEEDVAARLADLVATAPRTGRGTMLLLPWPAGDPEGAYLELRRGVWLPGSEIQVGRRESMGVLDIDSLPAKLTPEQVLQLTEPIATDLLHFEVELWAQTTVGFDRSGDSGPQWVWDSARAGGLLKSEDPRQRFALDLGPMSLQDPTDDVFPRRLRVTLVLGIPGREARLARAMSANDGQMELLTRGGLPPLESTPWLKVGSEWVQHGAVSGTHLTGVQRGGRGTRAVPHPAGTLVRAGKTVVLYLELAAGRDCWNG